MKTCLKSLEKYAALVSLYTIDGKKQTKLCKFSLAHLRQINRGVTSRWATQSLCNREWGAQRHNAKARLQEHGKSGHLCDWLCWTAPLRYFNFTLPFICILPTTFHVTYKLSQLYRRPHLMHCLAYIYFHSEFLISLNVKETVADK